MEKQILMESHNNGEMSSTFLVISYGDVTRFADSRSASGTMALSLSSLRRHVYSDFLLRLSNSWSRSTYALVGDALRIQYPYFTLPSLHIHKTTNGFVYPICWRSKLYSAIVSEYNYFYLIYTITSTCISMQC